MGSKRELKADLSLLPRSLLSLLPVSPSSAVDLRNSSTTINASLYFQTHLHVNGEISRVNEESAGDEGTKRSSSPSSSRPSLLPSSSRLRSSIGVHRLRNLSFDLDRLIDGPRLEEISALVQPSVWKQAHRRISSAPPLHSISKKFSFISYESDTVVRDMVNILSTVIPHHNGIFQIAFASQAFSPSGSINLLWTGSRPSRLLSSRALYVTSVPLERAEMITLDSKEEICEDYAGGSETLPYALLEDGPSSRRPRFPWRRRDRCYTSTSSSRGRASVRLHRYVGGVFGSFGGSGEGRREGCSRVGEGGQSNSMQRRQVFVVIPSLV